MSQSPRSGAPVPTGRVSRAVRVGGLASGVAGRMAVDGAWSLLTGARPSMRDLLMTPTNARRLADNLARMRGAAMKLGQLLSLDDGAVLSPEFAEILARLRDDAQPMSPKQLKAVLSAAWGADFTRRFRRFDPRPMAAASIGQVHRAVTKDGRDLAIKVQYPGVRDSIDSDIATLGTLMKVPGLMPAGTDLSELMETLRLQLHREGDYLAEAAHLETFGRLTAGDDRVRVPEVHRDLTTESVLAMRFVESVPIEDVARAPQAERDRVMGTLMDLTLREVFQWHLMQTDPNFANFRYQPETGRVVLLDFGATLPLEPGLAPVGRDILRAAFDGDRGAVSEGLQRLGLVDPEGDPEHHASVMEIVGLAIAPFGEAGPFDVAGSDLTERLLEVGMNIPPEMGLRHLPEAGLLFLQRKVAGLYLLAARLKARIPLQETFEPYLTEPEALRAGA